MEVKWHAVDVGFNPFRKQSKRQFKNQSLLPFSTYIGKMRCQQVNNLEKHSRFFWTTAPPFFEQKPFFFNSSYRFILNKFNLSQMKKKLFFFSSFFLAVMGGRGRRGGWRWSPFTEHRSVEQFLFTQDLSLTRLSWINSCYVIRGFLHPQRTASQHLFFQPQLPACQPLPPMGFHWNKVEAHSAAGLSRKIKGANRPKYLEKGVEMCQKFLKASPPIFGRMFLTWLFWAFSTDFGNHLSPAQQQADGWKKARKHLPPRLFEET